MLVKFDTDGKPLKVISHPSICPNAAFELEHELYCTINDLFTLEKGQWYLLIGQKKIGLHGRWIDERTGNSKTNYK